MEQPPSSDRGDTPRSTDPKTEPGNQASAQNAVKFGFFSTRALIPGESWEEFITFRESLLQQLCPRNSMEEHLAEQYIPLAWRLRRLAEIEAFAFTRYGMSVSGNQCGAGFALVASVQSDNILGQLSRYEATLRRNAFKYLDLLQSLRKEGRGKKSLPASEGKVIELEPADTAPPGTGAVPPGTENPASQEESPKEPGV